MPEDRATPEPSGNQVEVFMTSQRYAGTIPLAKKRHAGNFPRRQTVGDEYLGVCGQGRRAFLKGRRQLVE